MNSLQNRDKKIFKLISKETDRQQYKLNMIPSENYPSQAVREAVGSVLMNKYSEGEIGKRYYEGNEFIDEIEQECLDRLHALFCNDKPDWIVNVHALSGSIANLACYIALLKPGDKIMSMYLPDGGHISHGWSFEPQKAKRNSQEMTYTGGSRKVSLTSQLYDVIQYKTDPKTEVFDYNVLAKIAKKEKPTLIISGGTAYPQELDYEKLGAIAHEVGAYYMADIAHEAGLVAARVNANPIPHADVVTMTTHKTFRGPRGAVIFSRKKYAGKIAKALHHAILGGPFNNNIAGIAVAAGEASTPEFNTYAKQVVKNAQALAFELSSKGYQVVSGGTAKHLVLINLAKSNVQGRLNAKQLARALSYAGIVLNYNTVPGESGSPFNPSGIRLGSPIVTTRGMGENEMKQIIGWFDAVRNIVEEVSISNFEDFDSAIQTNEQIKKIAEEVKKLCEKFPLGR